MCDITKCPFYHVPKCGSSVAQSGLAETSLDNYFGLAHDIRDTAYISIDLKYSPICYSMCSVNAMIKMDERCLYKVVQI